jgi:hypothetical protein
MERFIDTETKRQCDNDLLPIQRDFEQLTAALLSLREDPRWSSIALSCVEEGYDIANELFHDARLAQIVASDDEQLALRHSGDRYENLNITKATSRPIGISAIAWGWEDEKLRYVRDNQGVKGYVVYEGEKDWRRQLDIGIHYAAGRHHVVETISLIGGSSRSKMPELTSQIWVGEYAETGYEGHNFKSLTNASEETVRYFMEMFERLVGAEVVRGVTTDR